MVQVPDPDRKAGEPKGLAYQDAISARRKAGLEKGRKIREANAVVRRLLKEGRIDPQRAIAGTLDPVDPVQAAAQRTINRWKLPRVIRAVPGIGPAKEQEIMHTMQVSPNTKLSDLRVQRRDELARYVGIALAKR